MMQALFPRPFGQSGLRHTGRGAGRRQRSELDPALVHMVHIPLYSGAAKGVRRHRALRRVRCRLVIDLAPIESGGSRPEAHLPWARSFGQPPVRHGRSRVPRWPSGRRSAQCGPRRKAPEALRAYRWHPGRQGPGPGRRSGTARPARQAPSNAQKRSRSTGCEPAGTSPTPQARPLPPWETDGKKWEKDLAHRG